MASGKNGMTPVKKGIKARTSRNFFRLVFLHANMEQVGDRSKMDTTNIKATLTASTLDTVYGGIFNNVYMWQQV